MKKLLKYLLAAGMVLPMACSSDSSSEETTSFNNEAATESEMNDTAEMNAAYSEEKTAASESEKGKDMSPSMNVSNSNNPLLDTAAKYESEGSMNYRLKQNMSFYAKSLSENLNGKAAVMQSGEGIIVSLNSGDVFKSDQVTLTENAKDILRSLAFSLKKMPDTYIVSAGRADADGGTGYNSNLAYKRAAVASNYLKGCGVEEDRFFVDSFGEKYPDFSNKNAVSKDKNRRVDFLLIPSNEMRESVM